MVMVEQGDGTVSLLPLVIRTLAHLLCAKTYIVPQGLDQAEYNAQGQTQHG
jgi:hypothetical protein